MTRGVTGFVTLYASATSRRIRVRPPLWRSVMSVTAVAVLAGACAGGTRSAPGEIGDDQSSATTAAPGPPAGPQNQPPATDRSGRPVPTTARGSGGATRPTTTGGGRITTDPIPGAAARGPGDFAGVLLQAQPATRLVVDVLRQPGADPRDGSVDRIASVLADVSGKPVRVSDSIATGITGDTHSAEEIRDAADEFGTTAQGRGTAVIRVLFLAGRYSGGESALGVAVRGDTFAVFPAQIQRAASPLASRSLVERAVVTHELGHLLGLVDLYLDRRRADPSHPGHSRNSGSVMFWAVESDLVTTVLGGPPPVDFDDDDRADLNAVRGGAPPG